MFKHMLFMALFRKMAKWEFGAEPNRRFKALVHFSNISVFIVIFPRSIAHIHE